MEESGCVVVFFLLDVFSFFQLVYVISISNSFNC